LLCDRHHRHLPSFPTRRSSDLFIPGLVYGRVTKEIRSDKDVANMMSATMASMGTFIVLSFTAGQFVAFFAESNMGLILGVYGARSEEHTSELQSRFDLVCRLLL